MNTYNASYIPAEGTEQNEYFNGNAEELKEWIKNKVGLDGTLLNELNSIISKDERGRVHVVGLREGELKTILNL